MTISHNPSNEGQAPECTPQSQLAASFQVGDRVISTAFTDCFGKFIPEVRGLVVHEVRRIQCNHIPDYDLVTAWGKGLHSIIASARFFQHEDSH